MEGNQMKMREALEKIWKEVYFYAFDEEKQDFQHLQEAMLEDPPDYKSLRNSFFAIAHLIDAALSAPPRQCDVGTPGEQAERFGKLCGKYYNEEEPCNEECPLASLPIIHGFPRCQAYWAQLPYAEKGAGK